MKANQLIGPNFSMETLKARRAWTVVLLTLYKSTEGSLDYSTTILNKTFNHNRWMV